jgi:hypothetical protein
LPPDGLGNNAPAPGNKVMLVAIEVIGEPNTVLAKLEVNSIPLI